MTTPPKMDLITVNNFLVKHCKQVDRSRVQIIHKLTRQIEQLQKKKGTDEQKAKNVRKADRFKKEIHIINKFHRMTVAKFSLINLEKSVEDDAINPDVMTEIEIEKKLRRRALLRIANHPVVLKDVEDFRQQFPEWSTELNRMLQVLGQKSKKKKEQTKKAKRRLERQKRREARKALKKPGDETKSDGSDSESNSDESDDSDAENESDKSGSEDDEEKQVDPSITKQKKKIVSKSKKSELITEDINVADGGSEEQESDANNASEHENLDDSSNSDEKSFANTLISLIRKPDKKEKKVPNSVSKEEVEDEEEEEDVDDENDDEWETEEESGDEDIDGHSEGEESDDGDDDDDDEGVAGHSESENEDELAFAQSLKSLIEKSKKGKTSSKSKTERTTKTVEQKTESKKKTKKPTKADEPADPKKFAKNEGEVLIKAINMSGGESSEEENEASDALDRSKPTKTLKDSFFLGGVSESESDEEVEQNGVNKKIVNSGEAGQFLNRRQRRENERWNGGERGGKFKTRGDISARGGSFRGRGDFSRGRGEGGFRGRGEGNFRGRGDFSRGRGGEGGFRGRGDGGFRGRGEFSRGRGEFSGGRGDGGFRGRGDYTRGRGEGGFRGRDSDSSSRDFGGRGRFEATSFRGRGDFSGKGQETENLHPSWAAKRKTQSIGEFQGKKIKFDDDDEVGAKKTFSAPREVRPQVAPRSSSQGSAESSNLHPSWAARKEQQKGIQAFQGKKIVFNNDD